MENRRSSLPFLEVIEGLKNLKRAGWVEREVPEPESVSDHMYRMAWFCIAHPELESEHMDKAILMCLIHDIGETTAGDITPADGIDAKTKHIRERLGVEFLSLLLKPSNPYWASKMVEVWDEYEEGTTRVAKLVHQIDKLECLHQALIYLKRHQGKTDFQKSFASFKELRKKISDPWLSADADAILGEWNALTNKEQQASTNVVFVIGGPGVGKGTLCARIAEELNFTHVSVGDLLREEKDNPASEFGSFIRKSIQESVIVPPYLTMRLLKDRVQAIQSQDRGVLVDGFPRSIEQAVAFEREISDTYMTVCLECSPETMIRRVQARSGSSNRDDDDLVTLKKRLATFSSTNDAIVKYLSKNKMARVDAARSSDEVFASVKELLVREL
ncbi:cytidylate kinase [Colletotrichum abscissum]|uniref:cytidylate kinase n=1 Tax=Colletotrichum abscissum TaxID=1671311 RepID=UPI0027D6EF70|nr:cytidylate kinase [Colletotrichum abscissum]KAK1471217.1 cytidylate kinase [Colletotrichum abscissum]